MTADILHLPARELDDDQKEYWVNQLEIAERQVEYARRMLGMVALEDGLRG